MERNKLHVKQHPLEAAFSNMQAERMGKRMERMGTLERRGTYENS